MNAVTRYCTPNTELVGGKYWLPHETFEYGWASPVGCNQLRCTRCKRPVRMHLSGNGNDRHYECGCQRHLVVYRYSADTDGDEVSWGPHGWRCGGHPDFELPASLDGIALAEDHDWAAVARLGLSSPPFEPPGVNVGAAWITRLYRLLTSETSRRRLAKAVADLTGDAGAHVVGEVLYFFINEPAASQTDRLTTLITTRRRWLAETAHPKQPTSNLLEMATIALHERLLVVDRGGRPVDDAALVLAKALALEGVGPSGTPFTFHDYAPDWLWDNAAALVRANADWLEHVVYLSQQVPADRRLQIYRAIADIGAGIHRLLFAEIAGQFEDPDRTSLLSSIAPGSDELSER